MITKGCRNFLLAAALTLGGTVGITSEAMAWYHHGGWGGHGYRSGYWHGGGWNRGWGYAGYRGWGYGGYRGWGYGGWYAPVVVNRGYYYSRARCKWVPTYRNRYGRIVRAHRVCW